MRKPKDIQLGSEKEKSRIVIDLFCNTLATLQTAIRKNHELIVQLHSNILCVVCVVVERKRDFGGERKESEEEEKAWNYMNHYNLLIAIFY